MPPSSAALSDLYDVSAASNDRSSQKTRKCAARLSADQRHQLRQGLDLLAVDLDQLETAPELAVDRGMDRLDERALAHAAGPPEQRIVGRQAGREAPGVLEQDVANSIDSLQEIEIDPVDLRDLAQAIAGGVPDKGGMGTQVRHRRRRADQAFQSRGNPFQPLENPLIRLACHMVHLKGRAVARVNTAGTGRGQASRAGCKWGNRRYIPPPEAPRLGRAGRLMAPPKAMPLFRRFL